MLNERRVPAEIIRRILNLLTPFEAQMACAASSWCLANSSALVYNAVGPLLLGKRDRSGVRLIGDEERIRHRILRRLEDGGCESLTVLTDLNRPCQQQDPVTQRLLGDFKCLRFQQLMTVMARNAQKLTYLHCVAWPAPDLSWTLSGLSKLIDLTIDGREHVPLYGLYGLRSLTVWYRSDTFNVQVARHDLLSSLTFHFQDGSHNSGVMPWLVDFDQLPSLRTVDFFSSVSGNKRIPLDPITRGQSRTLYRARVCGAFECEAVGDCLRPLGRALEVLSLSHLRSNELFLAALPRTLPSLRALECHNLNLNMLRTIVLPQLQTLVIVNRFLDFDRNLSHLVETARATLRTVSIAATDKWFQGADYSILDTDFCLRLLRCTELQRLQIRGRYYFTQEDWRMLCARLFPFLWSFHIWQTPMWTSSDSNPAWLWDNTRNSAQIKGMACLDGPHSTSSCLFVSDHERDLWPQDCSSQEKMYWHFFTVAGDTTELSIAHAQLPTQWDITTRANETRSKKMYWGPPLFMDRPRKPDGLPVDLPPPLSPATDLEEIIDLTDASDSQSP